MPLLAGLTQPASSVAVAESKVPSAKDCAGLIAQAPLASAMAWPIRTPPLYTCTRAPGSVVPATVRPSLGNSGGAGGASVSTVKLIRLETDLTCAPTKTRALSPCEPSSRGVLGVKLQLSPLTVALPRNTLPS